MTAKKVTPVFSVTNSSNILDPVNNQTYPTEEAAIEAAKTILQNHPSSLVYVNQRLRVFKANVTVEEVANEIPPEPVEESPDNSTVEG